MNTGVGGRRGEKAGNDINIALIYKFKNFKYKVKNLASKNMDSTPKWIIMNSPPFQFLKVYLSKEGKN